MRNDFDLAIHGPPDEQEHPGVAEEKGQPLQKLHRRATLEEVKEVFVGPLDAQFQLLGRHVGRLEYGIGPPVVIPLKDQQAALALELIVDRRTSCLLYTSPSP